MYLWIWSNALGHVAESTPCAPFYASRLTRVAHLDSPFEPSVGSHTELCALVMMVHANR
jgi:hypothetical protein